MDPSYLTRFANFSASLFQFSSPDDPSAQDIIETQHARSALSEKSHIGESLINQFVVINAPGYDGEWLGIVLDVSKNAVSDFEYKVYFPPQPGQPRSSYDWYSIKNIISIADDDQRAEIIDSLHSDKRRNPRMYEYFKYGPQIRGYDLKNEFVVIDNNPDNPMQEDLWKGIVLEVRRNADFDFVYKVYFPPQKHYTNPSFGDRYSDQNIHHIANDSEKREICIFVNKDKAKSELSNDIYNHFKHTMINYISSESASAASASAASASAASASAPIPRLFPDDDTDKIYYGKINDMYSQLIHLPFYTEKNGELKTFKFRNKLAPSGRSPQENMIFQCLEKIIETSNIHRTINNLFRPHDIDIIKILQNRYNDFGKNGDTCKCYICGKNIELRNGYNYEHIIPIKQAMMLQLVQKPGGKSDDKFETGKRANKYQIKNRLDELILKTSPFQGHSSDSRQKKIKREDINQEDLKGMWAEIFKYILEGAPSHKCCNAIKSNINFIDVDTEQHRSYYSITRIHNILTHRDIKEYCEFKDDNIILILQCIWLNIQSHIHSERLGIEFKDTKPYKCLLDIFYDKHISTAIAEKLCDINDYTDLTNGEWMNFIYPDVLQCDPTANERNDYTDFITQRVGIIKNDYLNPLTTMIDIYVEYDKKLCDSSDLRKSFTLDYIEDLKSVWQTEETLIKDHKLKNIIQKQLRKVINIYTREYTEANNSRFKNMVNNILSYFKQQLPDYDTITNKDVLNRLTHFTYNINDNDIMRKISLDLEKLLSINVFESEDGEGGAAPDAVGSEQMESEFSFLYNFMNKYLKY